MIDHLDTFAAVALCRLGEWVMSRKGVRETTGYGTASGGGPGALTSPVPRPATLSRYQTSRYAGTRR